MISLLRNPALVFGSLLGSLLCAGAGPQAIAQTMLRSGYALTDQRCGEAPNAYPKLRIGMRDGYCAGLVASEEDGLIFPRSIVAIPGHRQFVIADMCGQSLCCADIEGHHRRADAGRETQAGDRAQGQGADQPRLRRP